MKHYDLKWDQQLRFRLIEIIAQWEGRLTTRHLCDAFHIGRQQASKDINKYLKLFENEQLVLDRSIKGYRPTDTFHPRFTKGSAHEYLTFLHQQHDNEETFEFFSWGNAQSTILNVPDRKICPKTVRAIIAAARSSLRLDIEYTSLSDPIIKGRIIAPHSLVYNGIRWHVRAYCEEKKDYRDFVLSRFRNTPDILNISNNTREQDSDWNSMAKVDIIPNPFLNEAQQDIVAHDYGMKNRMMQIECRKALLNYHLKRMSVSSSKEDLKSIPEAFQLAKKSLFD